MAFFVGAYTTIFSGSQAEALDSISLRGASNAEIVRSLADEITGRLAFAEPQPLTGATQGVLASVFNNSTQAGSFIFGVLNSLNQLIFQNRIMAGVLVLVGAAASFLYWLLIGNVLRIGECRFYLENRLYPGSSPNRLFFVYRVRRTGNVARIMLLRVLYTALWSLTIVGGFVKGYQYRQIPFILAENPDISAREAFRLSKDMMRGHKWRTFLLDMSFVLWDLLSIATFGFVGFLYANPYQAAVRAELYVLLRQNALAQNEENARLLNDSHLFELSPGEDGRYPIPLFSLPEAPGRVWLTTDYHRDYSLTSLILLFFSYCLIGWLWELSYYLFTHGGFANPGVLHGPWLPIYGTGGILMLVLLKKWRDKPVLTFFLVMLLCGVVEYITGWFLETYLHTAWWDYSGYFLNLKGYVCLEGLIVFGVFGCVSIYFLAPVLDGFFTRLPRRGAVAIAALLLVVFTADFAYSMLHPNKAEGIVKEVTASVHSEHDIPLSRLLMYHSISTANSKGDAI